MRLFFAFVAGLAIMLILMVADKALEYRMGAYPNKLDKSDVATLIAAVIILAVVMYGFLTNAF